MHFLTRRKLNKMTAIFCLLIFSCQEKDIEESLNRTDTQLHAKTYVLPRGATEEFPSGFEIIASEGIEIDGDIVINPERGGDFTLQCDFFG